MIDIDGKLISEELFTRKFVCDLAACKGACCVEGDAGAPLEDDELSILDDIYHDVKPYMRKEGIEVVEREGKYTKDSFDGAWVTPLVNNAECAYVTFDDNGIAKCAIEQAYNDKKIDFKKPISCHLYPIRVSKLRAGEALNYNEWNICKPACSCGDQLNVKVYQFLKEPISRKYGAEFFEQLKQADELFEMYQKNQGKKL